MAAVLYSCSDIVPVSRLHLNLSARDSDRIFKVARFMKWGFELPSLTPVSPVALYTPTPRSSVDVCLILDVRLQNMRCSSNFLDVKLKRIMMCCLRAQQIFRFCTFYFLAFFPSSFIIFIALFLRHNFSSDICWPLLFRSLI